MRDPILFDGMLEGLDDRFLAEVRGLKHKNVAAELLAKLLKDEIKVRSKRQRIIGPLQNIG